MKKVLYEELLPEEFYGYILQENVYISIVKYLQN